MKHRFQAEEARERLSSHLMPTPVLFSKELSELTGKMVWLKLETQQPTGAFKVRPAFNGILCNLEAAQTRGVLTTSSGNFAQAVAYAASELGVESTIVMTEDTLPLKVKRTKDYGGEVVFSGTTFESRFEVLNRLQKERGSLVLHGFDSEETISGNGTLALELSDFFGGEEFAVFCPASGGGLISGIASTLFEINPDCSVFGFQPSNGGAIVKSLEQGQRVNVGKVHTIADALVASTPGERTFELIKKYVKGFDVVSEAEILEAMRVLFDAQKLVVEPGGAVGVAGLMSSKIQTPQENVVCIISGGNIDSARLSGLLNSTSS